MSASGPMVVTTPAKPSRTPAIRRGVSRSSASTSDATSTPKIAVAAFRIEASPEGIDCWPQVMSVKGITLFRSPITRKEAQIRRLRGTASPRSRTATQSTRAAPPTRTATVPATPACGRARPLARKEPPQIVPSSSSSAEARGVRDVCAMARFWQEARLCATRNMRKGPRRGPGSASRREGCQKVKPTRMPAATALLSSNSAPTPRVVALPSST